MEEDIKVLEENINNGTIYCLCGNTINKALENLIKGYKELEGMLKRRIKYTKELEKDLFEGCSNYVIPKSKVRKKIEKANKEIKQMEQDDIGVGFTLGKRWSDLKAKVKGWEELLQEGDK